jgi:hypothetical protein
LETLKKELFKGSSWEYCSGGVKEDIIKVKEMDIIN